MYFSADSERLNRKAPICHRSSAVPLSTLIQGHALDLRAAGRSPRTIEWYHTLLIRFAARPGVRTSREVLTPGRVKAFLFWLQDSYIPRNKLTGYSRPLGSRARQAYAQALRAFASWLYREGYTDTHRLATLRLPKAASKVIATFTPQQISSLLGGIDRRTVAGARDCALILFLLDTGARISEVCSLTLDQVDLEDGSAKVMGKGGKERVIPFGTAARKALWKWIHKHRPETRVREVFTTITGKPLNRQAAGTIIRRRGEAVGMAGLRCSPHTFRHTFATTYLRNGGDVFTLQRMLGHTTLDMVRRYVSLAAIDVRAAHRRWSPADNMDIGGSQARRSSGLKIAPR